MHTGEQVVAMKAAGDHNQISAITTESIVKLMVV
jgi:hypothetical protein